MTIEPPTKTVPQPRCLDVRSRHRGRLAEREFPSTDIDKLFRSPTEFKALTTFCESAAEKLSDHALTGSSYSGDARSGRVGPIRQLELPTSWRGRGKRTVAEGLR